MKSWFQVYGSLRENFSIPAQGCFGVDRRDAPSEVRKRHVGAANARAATAARGATLAERLPAGVAARKAHRQR